MLSGTSVSGRRCAPLANRHRESALFVPTASEASPAPQTALETHLRVFTPEGVELRPTPAGPVPRGLAWGLDFLLRAVLYSFLSVLGALGQAGEDRQLLLGSGG